MIFDTKCKKCRRAGTKLFLKGEKCFTPKCVFEKKPYPPGMLLQDRKHRSMSSEYGQQLREKQKVRNVYRLSEKQFSNYVKDASSQRDIAPTDKLFENLESRLDNAVYRLGLAPSRSASRQMVTHGHITVNGRRVDIPSYRLRQKDELAIREGSKDKVIFADSEEKRKGNVPAWLTYDEKKKTAVIAGKPKLEQGDTTFNFTSVIEFYSR
jgi:small subunit ribosomal protein S4